MILNVQQRVKQSWRSVARVHEYSSKWNIISYRFTYEFPDVSDIDWEDKAPLVQNVQVLRNMSFYSIPPQLHYMPSFDHNMLFTSCRL